MNEPIYLETGTEWHLAGSIEWPDWTRHAKAADDLIDDRRLDESA
jgi:hypothetical protein